MSVPAYQNLFSKHDEELHHFRRYNWAMIKKQLSVNFYLNKKIGYNFLLLPIRFLQIKFSKKPHSDTTLDKVSNNLLKIIINLETDTKVTPGRVGHEIAKSKFSYGIDYKLNKNFLISISNERDSYFTFRFTYKSDPKT